MLASEDVLKLVVAVVLLFTVPFLIAGRWDLPMVWAYIAIYVGCLLGLWLTIFRKDPDLLKERQQSGPGSKRWDRLWLRIYLVSCPRPIF